MGRAQAMRFLSFNVGSVTPPAGLRGTGEGVLQRCDGAARIQSGTDHQDHASCETH